MMTYKGYIGNVEYDADVHIFHGDVVNTKDVITFEGTSVREIEKAFRDSIDDYLQWCKEDGVEPDKPYSGKFMVRVSPELHGQIAVQAKKRHVSINKYVEESLEEKVMEGEEYMSS